MNLDLIKSADRCLNSEVSISVYAIIFNTLNNRGYDYQIKRKVREKRTTLHSYQMGIDERKTNEI